MELFLRIDDYTDATPQTCRAIEWLIVNGYRAHIAVIPGLLTRNGARFLEAIVSAYPGQLEFGQHGYIHTCRRLGRKRFEVGPGMGWREQSEIIAQGRQALRERISAPAVPVFTPPFNGYDRNTILALIDNGFEVLSAEVRAQQRDAVAYPLRDISINVDVCEKYFPRPTLRAMEVTEALVHRAYARDGYVGIMLHPNLTILTDSWLGELFTTICSIHEPSSVLISQVNTSIGG